MNIPQYPRARKSGLVVQEVPDEVLVYDLETNKAHCLNKTAAMVWNSCDGNTSISEISNILSRQTKSEVSEDLVWLAIDQLNETNLLENEVRSKLAGLSRREAIRRIGLASVVVLPVIASLVAPQSAMANISCTCTVFAGTPPTDNCASLGCPGTCPSTGSICSGSGARQSSQRKRT